MLESITAMLQAAAEDIEPNAEAEVEVRNFTRGK
jgi:hypothetical protein